MARMDEFTFCFPAYYGESRLLSPDPSWTSPFPWCCWDQGTQQLIWRWRNCSGVHKLIFEHALIFWCFIYCQFNDFRNKYAIGMPGIAIVGTVCDYDEWHTEQKKVVKILDWAIPHSRKEVCTFIGVIIYYRIFIGLSIVAARALFQLFRKNAKFIWSHECQDAAWAQMMTYASSDPHLTRYLALGAWDHIECRCQYDDWMRRYVLPDAIRRKTGSCTIRKWYLELKYDAVKLKRRVLLKAPKKFRFWLYGRYFTMDARTLLGPLNWPANDPPNTMMMRWLAYIQLSISTSNTSRGTRMAVPMLCRDVALGSQRWRKRCRRLFRCQTLLDASFISEPIPSQHG